MPISGEAECCGQGYGFVGKLHAAAGCLTGGEECQLGFLEAQAADLSDGQSPVVKGEMPDRRVTDVLNTVAGEVSQLRASLQRLGYGPSSSVRPAELESVREPSREGIGFPGRGGKILLPGREGKSHQKRPSAIGVPSGRLPRLLNKPDGRGV